MTELSEQTSLAVLGAGKMGGSLLGGLIARGWCLPAEIVATARRPERLAELEARYGIRTTLDNTAAVGRAKVVVVAVKPQDVRALLDVIAGVIRSTQTVVSMVSPGVEAVGA